MKEFVPNIDEAKRYVHNYGLYSGYSAAYGVTTESLHDSMKYMPANCNKALTVAASGDHPLFCSLYGVKQVDTFDISYNAKCIMDIKTAAIKCLNYSKYIDLLKNLCATDNVLNIPNINKISKTLSTAEWAYMCSMVGYRLFSHTTWRDKIDKESLLSSHEYKKLQKIVNKPYNFIWTPIDDLGVHLTESYDFIHLSNILDYMNDSVCRFKLVSRLFDHVNVGGRIVSIHLCGNDWEPIVPMKRFKQLIKGYQDSLNTYTNADDFLKESMMKSKQELEQMCKVFKNWRYAKISHEDIVIFERIR